VTPGELERIVIVSPHLDDAVLGCATLMAAHPGVTVVTVFAGRPVEYPSPMQNWDALCGFADGDEVHVARRAEDAAALGVLDATPAAGRLGRASSRRPERGTGLGASS